MTLAYSNITIYLDNPELVEAGPTSNGYRCFCVLAKA